MNRILVYSNMMLIKPKRILLSLHKLYKNHIRISKSKTILKGMHIFNDFIYKFIFFYSLLKFISILLRLYKSYEFFSKKGFSNFGEFVIDIEHLWFLYKTLLIYYIHPVMQKYLMYSCE